MLRGSTRKITPRDVCGLHIASSTVRFFSSVSTRVLMSHSAIIAEKKQLRSTIKERLAALSQREIEEQSEILRSMLTALPEWQSAHTICLYSSMPTGEVNTLPLIHYALEEGKRLFLPVVMDKERMEMFEVLNSADFHVHWKPNAWNIRELSKSEALQSESTGSRPMVQFPSVVPDLVLVPGVAFGKEDHRRLGHGRGYYDRWLRRCIDGDENASQMQNYKKPFLVSLALKEQVLDHPLHVPVEPHDHLVDHLIIADSS